MKLSFTSLRKVVLYVFWEISVANIDSMPIILFSVGDVDNCCYCRSMALSWNSASLCCIWSTTNPYCFGAYLWSVSPQSSYSSRIPKNAIRETDGILYRVTQWRNYTMSATKFDAPVKHWRLQLSQLEITASSRASKSMDIWWVYHSAARSDCSGEHTGRCICMCWDRNLWSKRCNGWHFVNATWFRDRLAYIDVNSLPKN